MFGYLFGAAVAVVIWVSLAHALMRPALFWQKHGTPLAVAKGKQLLGVIHLKDIVKPDIKERFAALRAMGIKTVMVTGDNKITAAAIASEAGVDDFIAPAAPEDKLRCIRKAQEAS